MASKDKYRVPVYFSAQQREALAAYAEATTEDALSAIIRRAVMEKVHAWQERQKLLAAQTSGVAS